MVRQAGWGSRETPLQCNVHSERHIVAVAKAPKEVQQATLQLICIKRWRCSLLLLKLGVRLGSPLAASCKEVTIACWAQLCPSPLVLTQADFSQRP